MFFGKSTSDLHTHQKVVCHSPSCYHKHLIPEKIIRTLTFELERRLKLKADEVGLLLQQLYGYNLVSMLKTATPLTLTGRWN